MEYLREERTRARTPAVCEAELDVALVGQRDIIALTARDRAERPATIDAKAA